MPRIANPAASNSRGWTILPSEPHDGPTPDLMGDGFSARAVDLWASWWRSPMAVMWAIGDAHELERLLTLYERTWERSLDDTGNEIAPPVTVHAEARQLAERFGLTPRSRQSLRWLIEGQHVGGASSSPIPVDPPDVLPAAGGPDDPRLRLVRH